MAFKIGTTSASAIYLGSTRITKAYLGTNLLFDETYITTQASDNITTQAADTFLTQTSKNIAA